MEVTKGIHQFSGVSNCYIVSNNELLLVDTGMPGKSGEIIDYREFLLTSFGNGYDYFSIFSYFIKQFQFL
jgi:hypothetical protein